MKKIIKVLPSAVCLESIENATVLEAALTAGVTLEHSCRNGSCGLCTSKIIQGEVLDHNNQVLGSGHTFLTCQCRSHSQELIIESEYYPELSKVSRKVVPCKVSSVEVDACFLVIKFRLPPTANFEFLPGQYINLTYQGITRSYSIANADSKDGIELHIRRVPDGVMSSLLFSEIKLDTLMRIDGPIGTFFVRESSAPIIFLAGGTGFAPVKAMVEALISSHSTRKVCIYWGMNSGKDFYSQLPNEWAEKFDNIAFIPVVSGFDAEWDGRTGLVHHAVLQDFQEMTDYCVYACGSPHMIAAAKEDFVKAGLSEKKFFSDAFTVSK